MQQAGGIVSAGKEGDAALITGQGRSCVRRGEGIRGKGISRCKSPKGKAYLSF